MSNLLTKYEVRVCANFLIIGLTLLFAISAKSQTEVSYRRFDGFTEELLAYKGTDIVLLIPPNATYENAVVHEIVQRLDQSWAYFRQVSGRNPLILPSRSSIGNNPVFEGVPTIAAVQSTCGGGCGMVGAAGIEIGSAIWEATYRNHVEGKETRGVCEYEMGRNFWFWADKLQTTDLIPYHWATAYATIFGYKAGVAGGSTTEPGNELVDWVNTYSDAYSLYRAAPRFESWTASGATTAKLAGGLFLHLETLFGDSYHRRFFAELALRPNTETLEDACKNLIVAASKAAGFNLYWFFIDALGFPSDSSTLSELHSLPTFRQFVSWKIVPEPRFASIGSSVNFSVLVHESEAPPRFMWFKDGNALDTQTNSTLVITPINGGDYGVYTVRAQVGSDILTSRAIALYGIGYSSILTLKRESGYARLMYPDIKLTGGKVFKFSCAIRGDWTPHSTDHIPSFRTEGVYHPQSISILNTSLRSEDGWTLMNCDVSVSANQVSDLLLATYTRETTEFAFIKLVDYETGEHLLPSPTSVDDGTQWRTDGGSFSYAIDHIPALIRNIGEPLIYVSRHPEQMRLEWLGEFDIWQAENALGPWTIVDAPSPVNIAFENKSYFFRLQSRN